MKRKGNFYSRRAMTLVEVVVIVVALTVAAVLLVSTMITARERSNRAACLNNLRQIGTAMRNYADQQPVRMANGQWGLSNVGARDWKFPSLGNAAKSSNELFNWLAGPPPTRHDEKSSAFFIGNNFWLNPRRFRCPSDPNLLPHSVNLVEKGQTSYSCSQNVILPFGFCNNDPIPIALLSDSLAPNKSPHGKVGQNVVYADGHGEWRQDKPDLKDRLDPLY